MDEDEGTSAVNLEEEVEHLVGELPVIGARFDDERGGSRAMGVAQKARGCDLCIVDRTCEGGGEELQRQSHNLSHN